MKNSWIIGGVVALLVFGLGIWMITKDSASPAQTANQQTPVTETMSPTTTESTDSGAMLGEVKEITVTGQNFKFDPTEIMVKKGDKVKITFKSTSGIHDLVLPDFKVQTKQLSSGGQETVEFIADKTGTFEYYCSVGNHKAMGMVGNLIVE